MQLSFLLPPPPPFPSIYPHSTRERFIGHVESLNRKSSLAFSRRIYLLAAIESNPHDLLLYISERTIYNIGRMGRRDDRFVTSLARVKHFPLRTCGESLLSPPIWNGIWIFPAHTHHGACPASRVIARSRHVRGSGFQRLLQCLAR